MANFQENVKYVSDIDSGKHRFLGNWEFPKKVKVDFVFLKGYSKMHYEKIPNQKPNETVSQGIITEAPPLVCGQSVPLLLNSFTNTSNRYQLVLQVLLSQGTKLNPSQLSRKLLGKGQNNSIKIPSSFPIQVTVQPCFLLASTRKRAETKAKELPGARLLLKASMAPLSYIS